MATEYHPPSWYQHQDIVEPAESLRDRISCMGDDPDEHRCAICQKGFELDDDVIIFQTKRDLDVWMHEKCFGKEYGNAGEILQFCEDIGVDVYFDTIGSV